MLQSCLVRSDSPINASAHKADTDRSLRYKTMPLTRLSTRLLPKWKRKHNLNMFLCSSKTLPDYVSTWWSSLWDNIFVNFILNKIIFIKTRLHGLEIHYCSKLIKSNEETKWASSIYTKQITRNAVGKRKQTHNVWQNVNVHCTILYYFPCTNKSSSIFNSPCWYKDPHIEI